jgi:hypothetical protein
MNIAKNMEAIFVVAAVLLGASAYATAALPDAAAPAAPAAVRAAAPAAKMQVVVVSAKRLSAAQKASLAD